MVSEEYPKCAGDGPDQIHQAETRLLPGRGSTCIIIVSGQLLQTPAHPATPIPHSQHVLLATPQTIQTNFQLLPEPAER